MDEREHPAPPGASTSVPPALAGAWLGLALVLAAQRWWMLAVVRPGDTAGAHLAQLAIAAYQDLLFVAVLALVGGLVLRRTASPRARRVTALALLAATVAAAAYAAIAAEAFSYFRTPLTYHMLELSDRLRGVRSSLAAAASPDRGAALLAAPLGVAVGAIGAHAWARRRPRAPRGRRTRAFALLAASFGVYVAVAALAARTLEPGVVVNPHWAMASSLLAREEPLQLGDGMEAPPLADDAQEPAASALHGALAGSSVVLVVLESVGAKRLAPWGGAGDVMPELTRVARRGLVFERVYAPQPRTSSAMVATFCSIHPWARRTSVTSAAPRLAVPGLADVLHAEGHRTALLHTGDLSFDREREFLEAHGFATVRDVHDLAPERAVAAAGRPRERGAAKEERKARRLLKRKARHDVLPDRALLSAATEWLDAEPGRPFFLVLWTLQAHHPYVAEPPLDPLAEDEELNRYLNALRDADRLLAELRRSLARRGLDASTMLVVLGDHGEAFGEHGTSFHGRSLYDEEVLVPLVLSHPTLDRDGGTRVADLGQQVDVAPTLLDLLGLPAPAAWQGRTLLAPASRPRPAYLTNVFDDVQVGLVDGRWKYVLRPAARRRELYDLAADPLEKRDLSSHPEHQAALRDAERRVAGFLRAQDERVSRLTPAPR